MTPGESRTPGPEEAAAKAGAVEAPAVARTENSAAGRVLVKEIAISAPAEAVWRALTEGEELRRWFPADARVEPGVGGKVWVSWGQGIEWEQAIDIWEPNRHLRTTSPMPGLADPFATDYYIEVRGGSTVLRLVNSGFGEGTGWDDMYFGMDGGWSYFLFNLRHYLERHAGKPRTLAFERRKLGTPRGTFLPALLNMIGRPGETAFATDGAVVVPLGDHLYDGRVALALKEHVALVIPGLDDALLFFELEPGADPHLGVYLSTYGIDPRRAAELAKHLTSFVDRLVPQGA